MLIVVRQHLFRSVSGGARWKRIVRGLDMSSSYVSLAAARGDSGIVFFLGTEKDGLYSSSDMGQSWNAIGHTGFDSRHFYAIEAAGGDVVAIAKSGTWFKTIAASGSWRAVASNEGRVIATASAAPANSEVGASRFLVATDGGALHHSSDGGDTWRQAAAPKVAAPISALAIAVMPGGLEHWFVGTRGKGIYHTIDGGQSYKRVNQGLGEHSIVGITLSPRYAEDRTIYAATWRKGVYHSFTGGQSWRLGREGLTKHRQADTRKVPHFYKVMIPEGFEGYPPIYLAAYDGLFVSPDRGMHWTECETLSRGLMIGLELSPDFAQDRTLMFSTYWNGVILSEDGGQSWRPLQRQISVDHHDRKKIVRLHSIAFSPTYESDNRIYAGIRDQLHRTTDHGENWEVVDLEHLAGKDDVIVDRIVFSPDFARDGVMFMGGRVGIAGTRRGAVYRSDDRGNSFDLVFELNELYLHSLLISPDFPADGTLFASGGDGESSTVYRTTDAGATWQIKSDGIEYVHEEGVEIVISPNYARDGTLFGGTGKGLCRTTSRGDSWQLVLNPELEPDDYIETIAISPNYATDRTLVVVARGRGSFRSRDGAESFQEIGRELSENNHFMSKLWYYSPGTMIQFSPNYGEDKTLYGFTGESLFHSTDSGDTWRLIETSGYKPKLQFLQQPERSGRLWMAVCAALFGVAVAAVLFFLLPKLFRFRR